jgi:RNA polymerase sigma factor (TIGR02999 family)
MASHEQGGELGADQLFSRLYGELHRMARRQVWRSGRSGPLGPTTLLHEAYLDISGREGVVEFPDRDRFLAYAAKVMRSLVIDFVRSRRTQKRGGSVEILPLSLANGAELRDPVELSRIGAAVDALALEDPELAELVDLKFFCGFSFAEIGALRGVAERTVQRHWLKARIYLHRALSETSPPARPWQDGCATRSAQRVSG